MSFGMEVENFGINPYGDSNKKLSVSYSYSYIHVWIENMGSGLRGADRIYGGELN